MNYDNKSDFNDEEEKTNLGSSGRQGGFDKFTLQNFLKKTYLKKKDDF